MSEYSHEDFPCEPRANTPEFDEGYKGIKWDTPHDKDGNLIRKAEDKGALIKKGDKVTIDVGKGRVLAGIAE